MILLVPLGPDAERPRLPRVTAALIALNVLVFLFTSRADTAGVAREEASLERIAGWTLDQAGRERPALAGRRTQYPTALAFLLRDTGWPDEITVAEDRQRLERCRDDYRRLREGHPFYRFGFVPADPASLRLFTHLFLHADPVHLLYPHRPHERRDRVRGSPGRVRVRSHRGNRHLPYRPPSGGRRLSL